MPAVPPSLPSGLCHITVFGDGGGESIVLCEPPDSWIVIDSMILPGTARNPAAELVEAHGRRWDAVVLTHPHTDHALGLADLLAGAREDAPVGCAMPPGMRRDAAGGGAVSRRATGAAIEALTRINARWDERPESEWDLAGTLTSKVVGNFTLQPLWPGTHLRVSGQPSRYNHQSTPLRVTWHDWVLMLGADLTGRRWDRLAAMDGDALASHLLKAPHHGSRDDQHQALRQATDSGRAHVRVVSPKRSSRLPSFQDGHGVDINTSDGSTLLASSLSFASSASALTRAEGLTLQRADDADPPSAADAEHAWQRVTLAADMTSSISSGTLGRTITA